MHSQLLHSVITVIENKIKQIWTQAMCKYIYQFPYRLSIKIVQNSGRHASGNWKVLLLVYFTVLGQESED